MRRDLWRVQRVIEAHSQSSAVGAAGIEGSDVLQVCVDQRTVGLDLADLEDPCDHEFAQLRGGRGAFAHRWNQHVERVVDAYPEPLGHHRTDDDTLCARDQVRESAPDQRMGQIADRHLGFGIDASQHDRLHLRGPHREALQLHVGCDTYDTIDGAHRILRTRPLSLRGQRGALKRHHPGMRAE